MAAGWGAIILGIGFILFLRLILRGKKGIFSDTGYKRIKNWLRTKHSLTFSPGTPDDQIRLQLEQVLEKEMEKAKAIDAKRSEGKKKPRYKKVNGLRGLEGFIKKQDYKILTEDG